ncbi:hypothetical protein LTR36_006916 [Oleoguttula mirabilis]|uniref:Regulator of volume decrease after cellular swelling-domain-containing protein n=1 Tax=Oleoguttula mirabilis TaxID=1507867 RepID=A0AAV9JAT4_9PEZI|nr:hypothetical protein LTR36_006916 [Oleoguttula mirabilis]
MAYEVLRAAPSAAGFTPLDEHLEQTPPTFFGAAKPVLHLHCPSAKLSISSADLASQPDFAALQPESIASSGDERNALVEIRDVDVWVTSKHLTLFSNPKSHGIQIFYPTITIHAQEGNAVLLELNLSDANTADEDLEFLQLRILPDAVATTAHANGQANGDSSVPPVKALYDAISACQELNPDPNPEGDGEEGGVGGFDETAPGATGWITSENMADFMDEDGNFRMPEGATLIEGDEEDVGALGAGAGRTRTADEVDAEDGADDGAKWQRTG